MYFTPQQLSGGPRYNFKTRMGNWSEDWEAHETKLKDYMAKKDNGALVITSVQQKYAKSGQAAPHTFRADGTLEYNDCLLLKNCLTNGTLVCDMSDRVNSGSEAYMVTTTEKQVGAIARSVYIIERAGKILRAVDNKVRYGDEIRIKSNTYIHALPLYLHSCPISPLAYARFSRNQEVCLHTESNYNTAWRVMPTQGNGFYGDVVKSGVPVILEHCATSQNLSNDKISYRNDFGNELEVSAKVIATTKRTQLLAKEKTGELTRETQSKEIGGQNHWTFELASEPSFTPEEASKIRYSGKKMVEDIRGALRDCKLLALRKLLVVFGRFDKNQDGQISPAELKAGLEVFSIFLNDEQIEALLSDFDRDGSNTLDMKEFSKMLLVS